MRDYYNKFSQYKKENSDFQINILFCWLLNAALLVLGCYTTVTRIIKLLQKMCTILALGEGGLGKKLR